MAKISAVINTFNEEKNIERVMQSVKWADEIIVCDMRSGDKTVEIAKKFGAKVYYHKRTDYVEPARNFSISKASNEWILILDADEEIQEELVKKLKKIADKMKRINYIEIPRINIIFGKWMKASMWWPDYHVRFFKKGKVSWNENIHSKPETAGEGIKLEAKEELAIVHHHYESISQFIERLNRYTQVQAKELVKSGYKFHWEDLITRPTGEFLSRFFANKGFEDGLHGLALSLLQAFSFIILYLKLWEMGKFSQQEIDLIDLKEVKDKAAFEINYWFKYSKLSPNPFKRFFQKARNKII